MNVTTEDIGLLGHIDGNPEQLITMSDKLRSPTDTRTFNGLFPTPSERDKDDRGNSSQPPEFMNEIFVTSLGSQERKRIYSMDQHRYPADKDATITVFSGRRGKGKTVGVAHLGRIMVEDWVRKNIPRVLASNFEMSFADRWDPLIMEQVSKYDSVFRQGAIMIDEAQEVFPSKRASSQAVYNAEVFLKAIRKLELDFLTATQFVSETTGSFQRQIDYIVQPQLRRSWEYLYVENALHRQVKHAALELKIWNWSGSATGIPLFNNMPYSPPHSSEQISRTFTGVETTFAAYLTKQVIVSAVAKDRHTKLANLKEIEALQDLEMAVFRDPATNDPVDMLPVQEFYKRLVETLYKGPDPGVDKVQKEVAEQGWQVVRDVDTDTQLVRRLAILEDDEEEWSPQGTAPRDLGADARLPKSKPYGWRPIVRLKSRSRFPCGRWRHSSPSTSARCKTGSLIR